MGNLIDLAPALELALFGAVLAMLATAVVAWRAHRAGIKGWAAWQRTLTVATLFLTIDLVVFGAFTRLTDSGLGCPDWPGCYGQNSPWAAQVEIAAEQAMAPNGPVTHAKAWIEMTHRYLATGVGALITGLMVGAWWGRQAPGALSPWWATLTFVWVCAQGAFGALTVTLKLQPIIVTTHLVGALLGVALLTAQVKRLQAIDVFKADAGAAASFKQRHGMVWWVLMLTLLQVALGGWVSANYAVLACTDFPTCQGQWWPEMDFENGFHLTRALGEDSQGGVIGMPALVAIHMAHRWMALVLTLAVLGLVWRLWQARQHDPRTKVHAQWLLGLLGWQLLSGLSNVVLGWPLLAALAHTLGATLLVWRLTWMAVQPAAPKVAPAFNHSSLSFT